jgi:hypothetical protein
MSKEPSYMVGERLNFWPHGQLAANTQPEAAVVAFVLPVNVTSPTLVNLAIIDHEGRPYTERAVRLVQTNDMQRTGQGIPEHRFATWPGDSLADLNEQFESDKEARDAAKKPTAKAAK